MKENSYKPWAPSVAPFVVMSRKWISKRKVEVKTSCFATGVVFIVLEVNKLSIWRRWPLPSENEKRELKLPQTGIVRDLNKLCTIFCHEYGGPVLQFFYKDCINFTFRCKWKGIVEFYFHPLLTIHLKENIVLTTIIIVKIVWFSRVE